MGRDLQKRKRRSSRPTIKQSNKSKKPLNPRGNNLVAKSWFVLVLNINEKTKVVAMIVD